jgi:cytoskeleton protein RodZ
MENPEFTFQKVGEKLKAERERRDLTLDDIAGKTRVPMRHLQAIEASEYEKLPGSTYSIGFTRSYASALDMDQTKIISELRAELAESGEGGFQMPSQSYEPADPSSVPSRTLAWTAAAIGILVVFGFLVWRSYFMDGAISPVDGAAQEQVAVAAASKPAAQTVAPANAPSADGQVTLTAKGPVWLKIYDAGNKRLFEAEMKAGDTYQVPKDANNPMIVTGRPEMVAVTIDGKALPPLGAPERTISDVGVSAAALIKLAESAKSAETTAGTTAAGTTAAGTLPPPVSGAAPQ